MTAPGPDLEELAVHVGPTAWAYHAALPEAQQVDVERAYRVHRDLRLVAADVLDTACLAASKQATGSSGGLKRVKVDGEVEIERFATTDAASVDASAWCAQAARLRREAGRAGQSGPVPSPLAGMRSGSSGGPAFTVTRRSDP